MRGDYIFASVSATDELTIVAPALAGHRARLVALAFVSTAVSTTTLRSDATQVTGPMVCVAGGVVVWPFSVTGWLQTGVGESLTLGAGGSVNGCLVYEYLAGDA